MKPAKNHLASVWMKLSALALALMLILTLFATNRNYSHILDNVMGGRRAVLGDDRDDIFSLNEGIRTKADALEQGNRINIRVCEEGFVLLKNEGDALPLPEGARISVFGKNCVKPVLSGSGSAKAREEGTEKTLWESLDAAGFTYNPELKAFYEDDRASGEGRTENPRIETSGNVILSTGETPGDKYRDLRDSYAEYRDAALIVISRIGGEGFDLPRVQEEDPDRHYLQLDAREEDLIQEVTGAGFGRVIVVINAANPMELGFVRDNPKIDACIWIGNPGAQGIMALGRILSGEVNPSGRLVDTYPADFRKDPVWQNFGDNGTENGDRFIRKGKNIGNYFVDYEESIYLGYRYYETVYADLPAEERDDWYGQNVIYPFGYGLSYTQFKWELTGEESEEIRQGSPVKLRVSVTNTGSCAGRDTVQVYAKAPYQPGGIEKSEVVLVSFAKTELLAPGASQELTLEVEPYAMSSYDAEDANENGFRGYELEAGEYRLLISRNAHEPVLTRTCEVKETIFWPEGENGYPVVNRFENAGIHLGTILSRSDMRGTFPASPLETDRLLSEEMYAEIRDTKTTGNPVSGKHPEMPVTGAQNGLLLHDLKGKAFDDPMWEKLLDQMSVQEMEELQLLSSFCTNPVESIQKPRTTDADGPNGFTNFMGDPTVYGTTQYCCEGVMAATFNTKLTLELGRAIGDESLIGCEREGGEPYTGWYAPAMNLHRGQFGGRNCEYFSEDPYLSGMIGASEIQGCNEKGVITYVKHFVCNEQETHRASGGDCSFIGEQAFRELYLKPFEYAVKMGKTRAIMTSFNRVGTKWTGGDYRLLTEVLRGEWGFHGSVITDFNTNPSYMNTRLMAYAGGTLDLASQPHAWADLKDPEAVTVLRENAHETLYAVVQSNAMKKAVLKYLPPLWTVWLIGIDAVMLLNFAVALAVYLKRRKGNKAGKAQA